MNKENITGRLENWYIFFNILVGQVYEHTKFKNGKIIHTSSIPEIIEARKAPLYKEGDIVRTLNSNYLLGKSLEDAKRDKENG